MSDTVGSVAVEVVPDARGWSAKLDAQIRDKTVTINANADTTEAEAQLDEVARTRTAKVKADTSQLSKGANALDSFVGKLGLLPALAIAGTAAIIPLAGALGGVAAALAAPLAIAGGGATLFGVLAGFAVKDTEKQLKVIDSLQKKMDGLTKGTPAYAQAAKALHDAQESLSPAQRNFSDAQSKLRASFQNFIGGPAGVALLTPLVKGMGLLAQILPHLTPILQAASGAFSSLLGGIGKAVDSPGFDKFIHMVSGQVAHDIEGFGKVLGNVASGLGGLFVQLDKSVGSSMVDTLVRLSGAFANWSSSDKGRQAIQSFIGYFHEVGPQVGHTLGAVAGAIGHIVTALAPLGPPVLKGIELAADGLSKIPVPVLTALAAAFVSMVAFQKVGGFKGISLLGKLGSLGGKGGPLGTVAGKAGVVPVYVTNEGFGGPGGGLGKGKAVIGGLTVTDLAITAGQVALVGAITYYGARGVQRGIGNVGNWAQTTAPGNTQYGGDPRGTGGPHLPTMTTPGARYYNAQTGRFYRGGGANDPTVSTAKSVTALDSLRSAAASSSRAIDMIGPHAAQASAVADRALASVQAHLGALHDHKFAVVAETDAAIKHLEALQALTIRDKSFNVIQNNIERNVGPGGGMMRHNAKGGPIMGAGTGTSDSIPSWLSNGEYVMDAATTAHNRALLDGMRGTGRAYTPSRGAGGMHITGTLNTPWGPAQVEGIARDVFRQESHADRAYDHARQAL